MQCPICDQENTSGNAYCSRCGRPLDMPLHKLPDVAPPVRNPVDGRRRLFGAGMVITVVALSFVVLGRGFAYRAVRTSVPVLTTTDLTVRTSHLNGKAVSFIHDSDSTPEEEERTDDEVEGFSHFLMHVGAKPLTSNLLIKVEPGYFTADGMTWYSHYLPRLQLTSIDHDYLPDADVVDKEYVHLTLQQDQPNLDDATNQPDSYSIEDAIARYLPCSYHDHSLFARDAETRLHIPDFVGTEFDNQLLYGATSGDPQERSRFWGGVFWELRGKLARDVDGNALIDTLLVAAWKSLSKADLQSADSSRRFVAALLAQDGELYAGKHLPTLRSVLTARGAPLPH